jgi:hypothetical protein
MVDNIIIHLHYIRLGDDVDLLFFLLFSGTCRWICFWSSRFFFLLFCWGTILRAFKQKKKEVQGEKNLFLIDHVKVSINFYSLCRSVCTAIFFLFRFFCMFYLHKRRVFCTVGLSRSLLCACCISLFLCVCACVHCSIRWNDKRRQLQRLK